MADVVQTLLALYMAPKNVKHIQIVQATSSLFFVRKLDIIFSEERMRTREWQINALN